MLTYIKNLDSHTNNGYKLKHLKSTEGHDSYTAVLTLNIASK